MKCNCMKDNSEWHRVSKVTVCMQLYIFVLNADRVVWALSATTYEFFKTKLLRTISNPWSQV